MPQLASLGALEKSLQNDTPAEGGRRLGAAAHSELFASGIEIYVTTSAHSGLRVASYTKMIDVWF